MANKNSTPSGCEVDMHGEYDWVIVKKQKVTILIPPFHVTEQSAMPNPGESQLLANPAIAANAISPCSIKSHLLRHSHSDGEKSLSSTPEKVMLDAKKILSSQPISTIPNLSRPDGSHHRIRSENPRVDNYRCHRTLGFRSASKLNKKSRSFLDGNVLLNQSLRALNLERKLQRAGGLSCWLASLGLDQFVKIFQGKSVNKFQLVNLTMKKLKDMGANAVGPRRKLMHAIDCFCQPYCFETL